MTIGKLERESARLREVWGALRRLHLGRFGTCTGCEEEIGMKPFAACRGLPRSLSPPQHSVGRR